MPFSGAFSLYMQADFKKKSYPEYTLTGIAVLLWLDHEYELQIQLFVLLFLLPQGRGD